MGKTKEQTTDKSALEDRVARIEQALIDHQILPAESFAKPQAIPKLDWNGFSSVGPEAVTFLYPRKEGDQNTALVLVHVDEQPVLEGERNTLTGAFVYTPESKKAYDTWRAIALPKQPPLVWEGELQQGTVTGDFNQAVRYSYESQTGYPPPNPPEGEGETVSS